MKQTLEKHAEDQEALRARLTKETKAKANEMAMARVYEMGGLNDPTDFWQTKT